MCEEPIHLFWSSGWDSTYRLLEILLVEKRAAQPHYILDESRNSNAEEARSLEAIREALFTRHPETRELLRPVVGMPLSEVPDYEDVLADFEALRARIPVGPQTGWLACYVRYKGLDDLELSWESSHLSTELVPAVLEDSIGKGHERRLREELKHPYIEVLRPFRFPVAHLHKADMARLAAQHGFLDILELSWFCHRPRHGAPCGVCVPCEYTIAAGLARRLPWRSRIRFRVARLTGRTARQTKRLRRAKRERKETRRRAEPHPPLP